MAANYAERVGSLEAGFQIWMKCQNLFSGKKKKKKKKFKMSSAENFTQSAKC